MADCVASEAELSVDALLALDSSSSDDERSEGGEGGSPGASVGAGAGANADAGAGAEAGADVGSGGVGDALRTGLQAEGMGVGTAELFLDDLLLSSEGEYEEEGDREDRVGARAGVPTEASLASVERERDQEDPSPLVNPFTGAATPTRALEVTHTAGAALSRVAERDSSEVAVSDGDNPFTRLASTQSTQSREPQPQTQTQTHAQLHKLALASSRMTSNATSRLPTRPPPSGVFGDAPIAQALRRQRGSGGEASSSPPRARPRPRSPLVAAEEPGRRGSIDEGTGNAAALFHRSPCKAMLAAEERERMLAAGAGALRPGKGVSDGGAGGPADGPGDPGHAGAFATLLRAPALLPSAVRLEPAGALAHGVAHAGRALGTPVCVGACAATGFVAVGGSSGVVLVGDPDAPDGEAAASSTKLLGGQGGGAAAAAAAAASCVAFDADGDMLLVGHASGQVAIWDVARGVLLRRSGGAQGGGSGAEHRVAITSAAFVSRHVSGASGVVLTADASGVVLQHTLTLNPFLKRLTAKTECLLDGKKAGAVPLVLPCMTSDAEEALAAAVAASTNGAHVDGASSAPGGVGGRQASLASVSAAHARGLCAIFTLKSVMFGRLFPSVEVCTVWRRPDGVREGAVPYASWRVAEDAYGSDGGGSALPALQLVVAWGKIVTLLGIETSGGFEMTALSSWELDFEAAGVQWLEGRSLCVLSASGLLSVHEPISGLEVATHDFGEAAVGDLAYHAHVANIYGNPERACHGASALGSVGPSTGAQRVYVLGSTSGIVAGWLRPWDELCAALAAGVGVEREGGTDVHDAGQTVGAGVGAALALAAEIACGEPARTCACAKLPRDADELAKRLAPALRAMSAAFAGEAISRAQSEAVGNSGSGSEGAASAADAASAIAGFCLRPGRPMRVAETLRHALFEDVYAQFEGAGAAAELLDALEACVLAGTVSSLPPELMQALVELRASRGEVARVEAAVLNMDIASLDFNQVIKLCEKHELYSALADVFSRGLGDVLTPLERLLAAAERQLAAGGANNTGSTFVEGGAPDVVYKLLLLLRCCFVGERFPPGRGSLGRDEAARARQAALEFVAGRGSMATLLRADVVATLETLGFAFDRSFVQAIETRCDAPSHSSRRYTACMRASICDRVCADYESHWRSVVDGANPLAEADAGEARMVDESLLQAVADCLSTLSAEESAGTGLMAFSLGLVIEFVAEQAGSGVVSLRAPVAARALQQLASPAPPPPGFLTSVVHEGHASRRQRAFMAVMDRLLPSRGGTDEATVSSEEIERMARLGGVMSAVAKLRARGGDLAGAFDALLADAFAPRDAPHLTLNAMLRAPHCGVFDVSADYEVRALTSEAHAQANASTQATRAIEAAHAELRRVAVGALSELASRDAHMAAELMVEHFAAEADSAVDALGDRPELQLECLRRIVGSGGAGDIEGARVPGVAARASGKYVALLCQFEPASVVPFLRSSNEYDLDACLAACRAGECVAGTALLLERAGEAAEALKLLLDEANVTLACLAERILVGGYASTSFAVEEAQAMAALNDAAALCDRASWPTDAETERAWFDVVRCAVAPLREVRWAMAARAALESRTAGAAAEAAGAATAMGLNVDSWLVTSSAESLRRLLAALARLAELAMEQAASALSLANVLKQLVDEHGAGELGDFRETIAATLGSIRYQEAITSTARSLVGADAFAAFNGALERRARARRLPAQEAA